MYILIICIKELDARLFWNKPPRCSSFSSTNHPLGKHLAEKDKLVLRGEC